MNFNVLKILEMLLGSDLSNWSFFNIKYILTCRVYKKSSPNNKLTLYLASRDIIVSEAKTDNKLLGVLLVDPDYVRDKKVRWSKINYKYLFFF